MSLRPAVDNRHVGDSFRAGLMHLQIGQLREAEVFFHQALAEQPDHAEALRLLGLIARQTGRLDLVVELIRRAIQYNGQKAAHFCNLGAVLLDQENID
jgi:protein O-GlcNAc transferase